MGARDSEIFDAIERQDLESARTLVAGGADLGAFDERGLTPLHVAVGQLSVGGDIGLVELLLSHGADPGAWDTDRMETPLLTASDPPEFEAVRLLLEAGADPNVRRSDGESPLRLCVRNRSHETAALLLRHGAEKTINEFGGDLAWTALGIAASNFDLPMIELLLAAGAKLDAEDDMGRAARDHLPPREEHDPRLWDEVMELLGRRPTEGN